MVKKNRCLRGGSFINKKIYWIGGSPCSGKSSIAEMLVDEYDFYYYKCDDYLEKYLEIAANRNKPISLKMSKMSIDEIFLRLVVDLRFKTTK